MLTEWIKEKYLQDGWVLQSSQTYLSNNPYPHLQINDFLREEKFLSVYEGLQQADFEHKDSDLFSLAQTPALVNVHIPAIEEFVEFLHSPEFAQWIQQITGVTTDPKRRDIFGAIYQDTDYLLCHDDQLEDRKVAFILYLESLTPEQGGALILYEDKDGIPQKEVKRYQPVANSLCLFTVSNESWHEVDEVIQANRVSIGGWLRG